MSAHRISEGRSAAGWILLGGATLWCGAVVAAPVFDLHFVHAFFSLICHQDPARSWAISNQPLAVCIRCTCIYFGFLAALACHLRPSVAGLKAALVFTGIQFILAVTILDSVLLRSVSGILLGSTAAPFVRAAVDELLMGEARNAV